MKKYLFCLAALLFSSSSIFAQANCPTYYANYMKDSGMSWMVKFIIGDIPQGNHPSALGFNAPGVKTISMKANDTDCPTCDIKVIGEFYPNGLIKTLDGQTFNYDKQWRLQNIVDKEGKVAYKYFYNSKGLLERVNSDFEGEWVYTYDENNKPTSVYCEMRHIRYTFKDGRVAEAKEIQDWETFPQTFKYDPQGRFKGYDCILFEGDDYATYREVAWTYVQGSLPVSITQRVWCYDTETKRKLGKAEIWNSRCTYTKDSKGNWLTWKATCANNSSFSWDFKRTLTYYTDEEVKTALAEMEAAKNPSKGEDKKEEMWEF